MSGADDQLTTIMTMCSTMSTRKLLLVTLLCACIVIALETKREWTHGKQLVDYKLNW